MKTKTSSIREEVNNFAEVLKSKPIVEYCLLELSEYIDKIYDYFLSSKSEEETKLLQSLYHKIANYYNITSNKKIYNKLMSKN